MAPDVRQHGDRSPSELSVIIVSWNTKRLLRSCLASIYRHQPPFPIQVIVVDNASGDGSGEMAQAEFPSLLLLRNQANLGFAAAHNQGAKGADAPLLLFLNSDTEVHPGTLAGAVAFMKRHPEAGLMGCRTLNNDGSLQASAFAFPGKFRIFAYVSGLNRFFKLSRFTSHAVLSTPDYVQGSFLIARREAHEKSGGFDDSFFLYAEEVDLCLRMKAAGFAVYYYPGVTITHHGGGSGGNSLAAIGHFMDSSIRLYQKYRMPKEKKRLLRALKAALRLRLLLESFSSSRGVSARKKEIMALSDSLTDWDTRN
jgi:GT2 family glycosyltransferase